MHIIAFYDHGISKQKKNNLNNKTLDTVIHYRGKVSGKKRQDTIHSETVDFQLLSSKLMRFFFRFFMRSIYSLCVWMVCIRWWQRQQRWIGICRQANEWGYFFFGFDSDSIQSTQAIAIFARTYINVEKSVCFVCVSEWANEWMLYLFKFCWLNWWFTNDPITWNGPMSPPKKSIDDQPIIFFCTKKRRIRSSF